MCYITWDLTDFGVEPIETACSIKAMDILLIDHEHVQVFDADGFVLDLRLSSKGWVWAWSRKGHLFGRTELCGWDTRVSGVIVSTHRGIDDLAASGVRAYRDPAVAIRHIVDRNWRLKRRYCARLRRNKALAA